jgi:hypothetical protein
MAWRRIKEAAITEGSKQGVGGWGEGQVREANGSRGNLYRKEFVGFCRRGR